MWNLIKRIYNFVTSVLLYSIFVILILIGLAVVLYFVDQKLALKSGVQRSPLFGAYVILTDSMVPNINVDDAVITMRVDSSKIKKNDVITFISSDPSHSGITITHRVVGINTTSDGKIAYRTKGDHNNVEDRTLVNSENVLGKVMLRIPYIGKLQKLLTTSYGWIFLIVLPCIFIILSDIFKLFKKSNASNPSEKDKNFKDIKEKQNKIINNEEILNSNQKLISPSDANEKQKDYNNLNKENGNDDEFVENIDNFLD